MTKPLSKFFVFFAILITGLIAYYNSFFNSFQFDDFAYIIYNKNIRDLFDLSAIWHANNPPTRFIGFLTFAINYHFHQLNVFGYHLVNFIIHVANGVGVYWMIILLTQTPRMKSSLKGIDPNWLALATSLIFLIHPIQTQAVTYIIQRLASLAAFFSIYATIFYLKSKLVNDPRQKINNFLISIILISLGMFTKENCFVWPLLILFFDNFLFNQNRQLKKLHVLVLILMSVLIPVLFLTNNSSNIFNPIVSQSFTNDSISPLTYFLTQCRVIWRYIFLIFYPFGLTLDYLFPIAKSLLEPATLLGFAGLISLIYIAFKARQRHPILTVGISWFLITISVESSFIPIRNVIFEHRMYLPSIGIVISFCYLLAKLLNKKLFVIIISVWSVFLIALTIQRNAVWRDEISLWTDNIKKMPNKGRPYLNLGIAYLHKSDPRQAIDAFTAAIEVDPKYYEAYNNRGQAHAQLGENSQAIVDYSKALDLKPAAYDTLINRGAAYIGLKNYDSALVDLVAAQLICSDCIEAINNMGVVFMARQQYDEAIKIFTRALVIDMAFSKAYNNRGAMYLAKEMLKDALADFNKAIELDPQYASAYANRARYYKHIGDMANAFQDAARAEKLGYNRIQSQ